MVLNKKILWLIGLAVFPNLINTIIITVGQESILDKHAVEFHWVFMGFHVASFLLMIVIAIESVITPPSQEKRSEWFFWRDKEGDIEPDLDKETQSNLDEGDESDLQTEKEIE